MSAMAARPIIAVLDTNVVIAGLLWAGPPYSLLTAACPTPLAAVWTVIRSTRL